MVIFKAPCCTCITTSKIHKILFNKIKNYAMFNLDFFKYKSPQIGISKKPKEFSLKSMF